MREQDLGIPSNDVVLAGRLVLPDQAVPCPLVICAHGTGAHDRNEGVLHVFDAVGAALAKVGVATYSFDKRSAGKTPGEYDRLSYWDFYRDFEVVFDHFSGQRGQTFTHIVALGHSEGTIMSAELANRRPVDGVILLSPFIENIETVLMAQAREGDEIVRRTTGFSGMMLRLVTRLFGMPSAQQTALIRKIKASTGDKIRHGLRAFPAKHLRELLALDPAETYRQLNVPTLVIGGGKDVQCNPEDVARIADVMGDLAEAHLIDDLSHLLRKHAGSGSFDTYKEQLAGPVDAEVLGLITDWVERRFPSL